MTIHFDEGTIHVECNGCNDMHELQDSATFLTAVDEIKNEGWRIDKVDDEWVHICTDCQGGYIP